MFKNRFSRYTAAALVGATLLAGALKEWNDYFSCPSTPRDIVQKTFSKNDLPRKPKTIEYERTRDPVSKEEALKDLEGMLAQAPFKKSEVSGLHVEKSEIGHYLETENRSQILRAAELIGRDSSQNLFSFINSPYLTVPKMHFSAPKDLADIKKKIGEDMLEIYVVSSLEEVQKTTYKISLAGKKPIYSELARKITGTQGKNTINLRATAEEHGFRLNPSDRTPIFYSTSGKRISKTETIAIEVFHDAIRPYTEKHIAEEIKSIPLRKELFSESVNNWAAKEEGIVHGIAAIWIGEYNKSQNLGLTPEEISERMKWYGQQSNYRQVLPMAKIVQQIGPAKAVELYVTDPERLFREVEKK